VGLLYMAPLRARSYGGEWMAIARTPLPEVEGPALVFVHDAWYARIATTLAAEGMRLDLVETLLRQNSTCRVHHLALALTDGDDALARSLLAGLDTVPSAQRAIPEHDGYRARPGEMFTPSCSRQLASDRLGITDISPLLWQADLHGDADARGTLIARDLGPERNADLIAVHRGRQAWLYVQDSAAEPGQVVPYSEGQNVLWGATQAQPRGGDGSLSP
jgi:hypothetical protein